jgi:general secretion pathway protein F
LHGELGNKGPRLRRQDVGNIMRELATMLAAGQDLDRALRYLHETAPTARIRTVVGGLRDGVRDGSPLSVALARYPRGFTRLHVALVRAGEASGKLVPTLERLADLLERQRALASSITSAMIYPGLLLVAAVGSIALLLTQVLPQFVPMFEQSGAKLPASTQFLIDAGDAVSSYGLRIAGVGSAGVCGPRLAASARPAPARRSPAVSSAGLRWSPARGAGRPLHPCSARCW